MYVNIESNPDCSYQEVQINVEQNATSLVSAVKYDVYKSDAMPTYFQTGKTCGILHAQNAAVSFCSKKACT